MMEMESLQVQMLLLTPLIRFSPLKPRTTIIATARSSIIRRPMHITVSWAILEWITRLTIHCLETTAIAITIHSWAGRQPKAVGTCRARRTQTALCMRTMMLDSTIPQTGRTIPDTSLLELITYFAAVPMAAAAQEAPRWGS